MSNDGKPIVNVSLDDILQNTSIGSSLSAITNNVYGFNHTHQPNPVPINKDHYGLTFFTRPQLNLTTNNIRQSRVFTPLLTKEALSYQQMIRCLLDPRLMYGYPDEPKLNCPLVDNQTAFIPLLTNHLKSISGWPDLVVRDTTSKEGAYQEAHSMVDSGIKNYTKFDITATFRNSMGDPITALFYTWIHYQSLVYEGIIVPYIDFITENEIDYNTRIYRLVLDQTKTRVQKIAATGASFPVNIPIGSSFDYSSEKPYNDANASISIQFTCNGAQYQDPILIHEFNETVSYFNYAMYKDPFGKTNNRDQYMVKIPHRLLPLFKNRGYPYIDPDTYEFSWWIYKDYYNARINALNGVNAALYQIQQSEEPQNYDQGYESSGLVV